MKKIVSVLLVVLMMSTLSVTVFAEEAKPDKTKNGIETLTTKLEEIQEKADEASQKREKFATKQEEWNEFQTSINEKKAQMQENKISMIALKKEIITLKLEIANALNVLKESGTALTDEQLASVAALNAQAKEILDAIKETKGNIKELMDSNKEYIKAQDFGAIETVFTQVYEIQEFRISQLTEAKGYLQQIADMLK